MSNLNKISDKDLNRLQTLFNRRERLINLNLANRYTQAGNRKIQKYYNCILYIRREINTEECRNINLKQNTSPKAFIGFLNPQNGLTVKEMFHLTSPNYAQ